MVPENTFSRSELEQIIESAINKSFRDLGFDQEEVFEFRKDLTFLREWRSTCELVRNRTIITFIGATGVALLAMLVAGIKGWINVP